MKKRQIYINIVLFIVLISVSVAWMITFTSSGEIATYQRHLIVPSVALEATLYRLVGDEYIEVTESPLVVSDLAPNGAIQFRFDLENSTDENTVTDIIFSDITGDINLLGNRLKFIATTPYTFELPLLDSIITLSSGDSAIKFIDNLSIPGNSTLNLYWQLTLDKSASNEVAGKSISIESINFVRP